MTFQYIIHTLSIFPPRSRVGSDSKAKGGKPKDKFQSTLPCRERLSYHKVEAQEEDFNPRSRVGSDIKNKQIKCNYIDCFCIIIIKYIQIIYHNII